MIKLIIDGKVMTFKHSKNKLYLELMMKNRYLSTYRSKNVKKHEKTLTGLD